MLQRPAKLTYKLEKKNRVRAMFWITTHKKVNIYSVKEFSWTGFVESWPRHWFSVLGSCRIFWKLLRENLGENEKKNLKMPKKMSWCKYLKEVDTCQVLLYVGFCIGDDRKALLFSKSETKDFKKCIYLCVIVSWSSYIETAFYYKLNTVNCLLQNRFT